LQGTTGNRFFHAKISKNAKMLESISFLNSLFNISNILQRLNKYLASKGIASRRKSDDLITAGKIRVNNKIITKLGTKISESDKVEIDKKILEDKPKLIYYILNKPPKYITANSPTSTEKNIVIDLLPKKPRIFPVGRLDKMTTGLLILTNDGNLSYKLTHPKFECEKEYEVQVSDILTNERIRKIEAGMRLNGKKTKTTNIQILNKKKARIILREGKNRQIRKIFGKVGCEVISLKRIRVKDLMLGDLPVGEWRELNKKEIQTLLE
jgi:23S rRNA pseudouridine2605 synthase